MNDNQVFRCPKCNNAVINVEGRFWCNICSIYCTDGFRKNYPGEIENIKAGVPSNAPVPSERERAFKRGINWTIAIIGGGLVAFVVLLLMFALI